MTKMNTRKTLENTKVFVQYLDKKGDKITLSFRNEKSFDKHMLNNKISKNTITYKSNVRPKNPDVVGSLRSVSSIVTFGSTTRRGIGGA